MKTILVIGGGVTGLSAMYTLQKWKKESGTQVRLILAESASELGGKIHTVKKDSFMMETGADSIVSRKARNMSFIEELSLENEVVYNATGISYLWTEEGLKPIPADSVFGIPATIESLAKSTLVSSEGKVEALKDFYTKNEIFTENDSIGQFLEYFLGKELVEKQIAPVLSGVYSGNLSDLTISSTLPYLLHYKEEYGSIMKGLSINKKQFNLDGSKKFLSFRNGLSTLISAYEQKLEGVDIRKNTRVIRIEKENQHYNVFMNNGESIEADAVILSIPNTAAESLFQDHELKDAFSSLQNSSMMSVYMGFDLSDQSIPLNGTGFIAPKSDNIVCNACTWTSRKWKHTSREGNLLVRMFYKSSNPYFQQLKNVSEQELLQTAGNDLKKTLGIEAEPVTAVMTNWSDSMPNYSINHPKIVQGLESKLADNYPGVLLAGSSYYGVGIPDCIENGEKTAEQIISYLL